jgi:mono/diheme cytochrome c family protein
VAHGPARSMTLAVVLASLFESGRSHATDAADFFEAKVRPILVQHCQKCHGPEKTKGGLRLDSKAGWQKGGDQGPVIVPGNPAGSLLIRAIQYGDPDLRMPPRAKLPDRDIATLVEWVKRGAPDPRNGEKTSQGTIATAKAMKWWSLQPVTRPPVPKIAAITNPIDAFIIAKLHKNGLQLSPRADKRTLIRRATYDLTGLPPTPEEVEAFLADHSPDAFAKVIDRLLASPHYGERWGRHWLDLVRYADTAGENSDHPLPHAWRYRNWVIDAVNRDQPYDEFLRQQIAGDILATQGPPEQHASRIIATGFLALARRFGHDIDKDMHLTHEDVIDTLGKTVLGLSLGCARCHAHKYDPISVEDYYALYGIFDSTRFSFPGCEPKQQPRDLVSLCSQAEWNRRLKPVQDKLADLDRALAQFDRVQAANTQQLRATMAKSAHVLARGQIGDGKAQDFIGPLLQRINIKPGEMIQLSITPLANHGADTTLIEWEIAEIGGKNRRWNLTRDVLDDLVAANPHADRQGNIGVWWFLDGRNGPKLLPEKMSKLNGKAGLNVWRDGDTPSVLVNAAFQDVKAWTRLPARSLFVHPAANGPVAVGWVSPITGTLRITGRVVDAHPGGSDGVGWQIEHFAADLAGELQTLVPAVAGRQKILRDRSELSSRQPKMEVAYAASEGRPHDARIHLRGDPEKLGATVPRRVLEILGGQAVPPGSGSGRLHLARWLTRPENPLTARVMVNRIWQHHFGTGLVKTPSDFGARGQPPTHPELLDWLAAEFMQSGWSIRHMHRLIMLSAVYRQQSSQGAAGEADPAGELYGRFTRRRLSAEEIRDSLLHMSGRLERTQGGPHPFPPESTWSFTQHAPFNAVYDNNRRSVYLMVTRNRRHPFLGLFDGADPNATTPWRQETTVPTQALYFMNDPFFHEQAAVCADRFLARPDDDSRVNDAFRLIFQRAPTPRDMEAARSFLDRYRAELTTLPPAARTRAAWSALARILLASNEFLYLD